MHFVAFENVSVVGAHGCSNATSYAALCSCMRPSFFQTRRISDARRSPQAGMYSIKDFNILPKKDSSASLHKKREGDKGSDLVRSGDGKV